MVRENIISQQIVDLPGGISPFIPYSSSINKSLEQEVQSIVSKVDSNEIAGISQCFSERDGKEGWYDNIGIRFSLFDLRFDNYGNSKNKPIIKIQDEYSTFSNELKEMFELISNKNRDVLYVRRRPVEQGQQENHWVVFYFFMNHNQKNILFVDTQNPSIGRKNNFRNNIDEFLTKQDCNLYISSTKIQNDDYSCGPIASEITRMLWNNHKKVKEVLSKYSVENREEVVLDLLMDNHFEQLSNSFSTKKSINYGNITKEFNAASIRTAHFVTGLYIGLVKLLEKSCDVGTKKLIESIRLYFISNPSNVALFNEQIKKISQGESEMPKTKNFKNPQEIATDGSDVKANDTILYPVEQQTSGTIYTDESLEYERELIDSRERIQQLEQVIENLNHQEAQLKEGIDSAVARKLEQEESFEQAQQEINNLTEKFEREQKLHRDTANKAHAQLAEKGRELIDLRKNAQEMEQVIENLNGKLEQAEQKNLSRQKIISDQSRKQSNYASASFILAGMFAVGVSLTIPYLALCITLAVAASIFLIAGGCCLYKANTALSDVKADQIASVVGALNNF